jgi:putative transposase
MMSALSARHCRETVQDAAHAFGVSPSSVSRHFMESTSKQLKQFLERDLSGFDLFAIMLDGVHRGGVAFITAFGISVAGKKMVFSYLAGATENSGICKDLLADIERPNLNLAGRELFVTDGGKGLINSLRDKFGRKLIHQGCAICKDHILPKHFAREYCRRIHWQYVAVIGTLKQGLMLFNTSTAMSLREALPELLTLHIFNVHKHLCKVLHTTNGIENLISSVRHREHNNKNNNLEY